jgi:hypothetical protein
MSAENEISPEEQALSLEMQRIYNSGNCRLAAEMSVQCLKKFPASRKARYNYAVYHGDLSYEVGVEPEEREKLLKIAKDGFESLISDSQFLTWPQGFQDSVRNEYYWFLKMHQEQYDLGVEINARGENGHYSACVGAAMLALKALRSLDIQSADKWAQISWSHFQEFEKVDPTWYNINFFGAQALACRGRVDEARICFRDMFRKQGTEAQDHTPELERFEKQILEIKGLRADPKRLP